MQTHERYSTLAAVISVVLTVIGTAAALAYYLSITHYRSVENFFFLLFGYSSVIIVTYHYTNRRLKHVRES